MPITCDWYDQAQRIILYRIIGSPTLAETTASNAMIVQLSQQASGRFDIIADMTEAGFTPAIGALWEWKQMVLWRDITFSNWGLTVFVNTSPVWDAYFEEGIRSSEAVRQHCRLVKSVDEAVATILTDRAISSVDKP